MATHWSSSHSQWWSALRYCAIPTLMKPVVDGSPWPWSDDGSPIDFFGESQRPFRANAWKRRREEVEKSAAAGGAPPKKFSKLQPRAKSNWGLTSPPPPPHFNVGRATGEVQNKQLAPH